MGDPWTADYLKITGELDVDLRSNIAAEARAKIVYERLIDFCDDPEQHRRAAVPDDARDHAHEGVHGRAREHGQAGIFDRPHSADAGAGDSVLQRFDRSRAIVASPTRADRGTRAATGNWCRRRPSRNSQSELAGTRTPAENGGSLNGGSATERVTRRVARIAPERVAARPRRASPCRRSSA